MSDKSTSMERSREKLKNIIKDEITVLFENALDFAHVACPPATYPQLRSKILRVGNNCIRSINTQLLHFDIEYRASAEDVIEVRQKQK
jgi:hypothetical protein